MGFFNHSFAQFKTVVFRIENKTRFLFTYSMEIKRKELEEMVEREKLANCTNDIERQYIEIDLLNIVKDKKKHEDVQVGALKEKDAILELIRELCDVQGVLQMAQSWWMFLVIKN